MRLRHSSLLAAVAGIGLMSSAVHAAGTLSVTLVPVTSDPGAGITNTIASPSRTFDLVVAQNGELFNAADVKITLPNTGTLFGSFYLASVHAANNQRQYGISTNANFDTSVTTPMYDSSGNGAYIDTLGTSDIGQTATTGNGTVSGATFDIQWGDRDDQHNTTSTSTTTVVSYPIARFTVLGNTGAFFSPQVTGSTDNFAWQTTPNVYIPLLGDVNSDQQVDTTDFNIWLKNAGKTVSDPGESETLLASQGDINQDGQIDTSDFNDWIKYAGGSLSPGQIADVDAALVAHGFGALVPEPASASLLGGLLMMGLKARRRAKN